MLMESNHRKVLETVWKIISDVLGVHEGEIAMDTDIYNDLGQIH
jgi:hypothetical protein